MPRATGNSENEFTIPDRFIAAHSPDDFILVVEEKELHVSKAILAVHSEPLSKLVYDIRFREAREGRSDLEDKKLSEVVPLLCWMYHLQTDPKADGKIYGTLGQSRTIAIDDLVGLRALAYEWLILPLQEAVKHAYYDFISKDFRTKVAALKALKASDTFGLDPYSVMYRLIMDRFIKAGVNIEDVLSLNSRYEYWLLKEFLSRGVKADKPALLRVLARLEGHWASGEAQRIPDFLDLLVKAGVNVTDIRALKCSKKFHDLLLEALLERFEGQQKSSHTCLHCGERRVFPCSGTKEHSEGCRCPFPPSCASACHCVGANIGR